ncbi:MAG: ParB N-terminal domain-containing protein [Mangrovicoccus sp.]|nr:ParB N-terminal domain-containing protein [Mangrovicoccus sp.]
MARRRRLTPAQPGYLDSLSDSAPNANPSANLGANAPSSGTPIPNTAPNAAPGTVIPPIAQVSGQSAEAAALRELTQGLQAAREEGRMVVEIPLEDIATGYLTRDRIAQDSEELAALKASIQAHGQRSPAEITPLKDAPDTPFGLISGWRRYQALSELFAETGEPRFARLRALIRPAEEAAQSYVAMVEENEIRVGLSYYERARLVAECAKQGVFLDQSAALRSLFATASRAKRSKIGSFIDIYEGLGDVLRFPGEIPERLGLALVGRMRLGAKNEIRAALMQAAPQEAAAELALLEKLAAKPAKPGADVSRAKPAKPAPQALRPGVDMALKRAGSKLTVTLSGKAVDEAFMAEVEALLQRLQQPISKG